jgi:hypothetical protein
MGKGPAGSKVKMSVNNVKSSAYHIQQFAREARAIEKARSWRGMSSGKNLWHGKVYCVLVNENGQ